MNLKATKIVQNVKGPHCLYISNEEIHEERLDLEVMDIAIRYVIELMQIDVSLRHKSEKEKKE